MSAVDAEGGYDAPLRRIRSTGDVPRRPNPIHRLPMASRHSDSHSDLAHQQGGPSFSASAESPRITAPPAFQPQPSLSRAQTLTVGGVSRPNQTAAQHEQLPPQERSWFARALNFLGVGRGAPRERRTIVALYFTLLSGFVQIVVISVILGLAGTRLKSPRQPNVTEWVACNRPLGIWACIWVIRALLACSLTYWGFLRDRKVRQRINDGSASGGTGSQDAPQPRTQQSPRNSAAASSPIEQHTDAIFRNTRELPYARLYSRLTLLSSLLTLSWFLTAHILEYTSINTCRHTSPHIWWLTFGILCLMYLSVLEVIILSFVVFVIAPILFLFWNIILICMGRHPLQTGNIIKPEIGKLSKSVVDRIPLVIYIPPPPEGLFKEALAIPDPAHVYPPKPTTPPISASRKRFRFIRMLSSQKTKAASTSSLPEKDKINDVEKVAEPQSWEEHWEKGDYPFVVLEGNRAACAICLMDFEEPKRLGGLSTPPAAEAQSNPEPGGTSAAVLVEPVITLTSPEDGDHLKLEDAGEGAQPLRLLECGHVFHKTCLDPWLTDVSGRCPVCQRAVVLPEPEKNQRVRR